MKKTVILLPRSFWIVSVWRRKKWKRFSNHVGLLYHIDSVHVLGNAKISRNFLQHYLAIPNGSLYNKKKTGAGHKNIRLPYFEVQPNDITMLRSGSLLNLYQLWRIE
jgi:hypothetical protein